MEGLGTRLAEEEWIHFVWPRNPVIKKYHKNWTRNGFSLDLLTHLARTYNNYNGYSILFYRSNSGCHSLSHCWCYWITWKTGLDACWKLLQNRLQCYYKWPQETGLPFTIIYYVLNGLAFPRVNIVTSIKAISKPFFHFPVTHYTVCKLLNFISKEEGLKLSNSECPTPLNRLYNIVNPIKLVPARAVFMGGGGGGGQHLLPCIILAPYISDMRAND